MPKYYSKPDTRFYACDESIGSSEDVYGFGPLSALTPEAKTESHTFAPRCAIPTQYHFWIYSASMKAAVELLSDESLVTWQLHAKNDSSAKFIIRPWDEPSPNNSQTQERNENYNRTSFAPHTLLPQPVSTP